MVILQVVNTVKGNRDSLERYQHYEWVKKGSQFDRTWVIIPLWNVMIGDRMYQFEKIKITSQTVL